MVGIDIDALKREPEESDADRAAFDAAAGDAERAIAAATALDAEFAAALEAGTAEAAGSSEQPDLIVAPPPPKRARTAAAKAAPVSAAARNAAVAVKAPPLFDFDHLTLGGRPLEADRGHFRAVFPCAKLLGDVLAELTPIGAMFPLTLRPDGITIRLLDGTTVVFFELRVPAASFLCFENSRVATTVLISSSAFQTRKSQFTDKATLTLAFQTVPAEAKELIVQLYPRSGRADDGIVTRFGIAISDNNTEYEAVGEIDDTDAYHYQITLSYALIMRMVANFKAASELAFTVTDTAFELAGRCDENSRQMVSLPFVTELPESTDQLAIQALLLVNPDKCHRTTLQPSTRERPANVLNFRLSLIYLRRALKTMVGSRCVQLSLGRSYAQFNGEFSPARLTATYFDGARALFGLTLYISPKLETEN